jgi:uncharacterized protein (TIGR02270 family)
LARTRRYQSFTPQAITALRNSVVIKRHADQAAFPSTTRARAVRSSKYRLRDLARLDERVEANLQGLVVAREDGWRALEEQLEIGDDGEVFAAACGALLLGKRDLLEPLMEAARSDATRARAIVSAFGWAPWTGSAEPLRAWLRSSDVFERLIALDAFRAQRKDPGEPLRRLLDDAEPIVRVKAARLVGELGLVAHSTGLSRSLSDRVEAVRVAAAWSLCLLGVTRRDALAVLMVTLYEEGWPGGTAADMLARCMSRADAVQLVRGLRTHRRRSLYFVAVAAAGWPELVEDLIASMEDERQAPIAGAAFSQITGADLACLDLERTEAPHPDEKPKEGEAYEESPTGTLTQAFPPAPLDLTGHLPLPDAKLVSAWWRERRSSWDMQARYLAGRPISNAGLRESLREGTQPQRRAAALETARKTSGTVVYATSQPGWAQARDLLGWT